jgi:hypothetical protein
MPAYVNDAQTLADVVGPAAAANQMQTQNAAANVQQDIANQVAQGTEAADIQKPYLQNLFTQANTNNTNAIALQNSVKGLTDQAEMPSAIGAGVAANQAKMTADQVSKISSLGQLVGQVAGVMDNVPPPARQAAMTEILQRNNIDPSTVGPLISGDPDTLRSVSQKMIQASASYQTQMMSEEMRNQGSAQVATIGAQSREREAKTIAQGRTDVASINAAQRAQQWNNQKGALAAKVAQGTATPAEQQTLQWMTQSEQMARQGNPMAQSAMGINVEPNVPNVPNTSPQQPAAPQAPQQVPPTPALQTGVEQKWGRGSYDPNKYTYVLAVNPATGKPDLGRIPK